MQWIMCILCKPRGTIHITGWKMTVKCLEEEVPFLI